MKVEEQECVCVCVEGGSTFLNNVCFQAIYSPYRDRIPLQIVRAEVELSAEERAYLTAVEKGNTPAPSLLFHEFWGCPGTQVALSEVS